MNYLHAIASIRADSVSLFILSGTTRFKWIFLSQTSKKVPRHRQPHLPQRSKTPRSSSRRISTPEASTSSRSQERYKRSDGKRTVIGWDGFAEGEWARLVLRCRRSTRKRTVRIFPPTSLTKVRSSKCHHPPLYRHLLPLP